METVNGEWIVPDGTTLVDSAYKDAFSKIEAEKTDDFNGTINYDNGFCDEYDRNAITIYAKDLNGLFKPGMILKESSIGIQTISQDYIEFLLENNGLSREDCLCILYIG